MAKLAIDGGTPVSAEKINFGMWPPVYDETEKLLVDIYRSQAWSFYGKYEVLFNEKFAEYCGTKYAVMMANGTVTLEAALNGMGIGKGDEVIVPAHSWLATGSAVVDAGATPVIVDIERDTVCMDPAAFEAAITPRTRAVIPVHLFGSMANMDEIMAIARKHDLKVIEDCAHGHGGFWDGKHVGSIGDIGSFSFQQSKLMASGEGGSCITSDDKFWENIGRISHIGYQWGLKQGQKGTPPPIGLPCHNYRVTDFQAAILLGQLEHLAADTAARAEKADYLRAKLDAIPGIKVQAKGKKATLQHYYIFAIMVDHNILKPGITKVDVMKAMGAEGFPIFDGWGAPMYKHNLWNIDPKDYILKDTSVAEDIVFNDLMMATHLYLHQDYSVLDNFAEAMTKVMAEYHI